MSSSPLTAQQVARYLRVPDALDDKYRRGVVTIVAGSETYPGAGVLSVGGALRTGAGMVRFRGGPTARQLVLHRFPEVVVGGGQSQAVVIGPGWDTDLVSAAKEAVGQGVPLVVDAGALEHRELWQMRALRILTPHAGEAARLFAALGHSTDIASDPQAAALRLAELTESIVVLKGASTYVADPQGRCIPFTAPTAWGAVAGAGDVLAGVIGSVAAGCAADTRYRGSDVDLTMAVAAAVWIHGNAVAWASGIRTGGPGEPIVASDIVGRLPAVIQELLRLDR